MAPLEVTSLHWYCYTHIASDSDFQTLLNRVIHPDCHFFEGPAFFKPATSRTTEALKSRSLTLKGTALELKAEWIDEALTVSKHLVECALDCSTELSSRDSTPTRLIDCASSSATVSQTRRSSCRRYLVV